LFGENNRENEVVEQTLGYTENSQEAARQVGPASKPFGEQTLAALVAAAAIGFVLGALWKGDRQPIFQLVHTLQCQRCNARRRSGDHAWRSAAARLSAANSSDATTAASVLFLNRSWRSMAET
jgi:hypothetical protein